MFFLYVNKRNDIRKPNIVLCLAVEILSHGLSKNTHTHTHTHTKKKKKKKKISSRISYQTTLLLDKPKTVRLIVLTACVRPFKSGTAG